MSELTDQDRLVAPGDVAAYLGVSALTLADWRTKGKGPPFVKLVENGHNGMVRYSLAAVRQWVTERTRDA